MAGVVYKLCLVVLLATLFTQQGHGARTLDAPIGSLSMVNSASQSLMIRTAVQYTDGHQGGDPDFHPLPTGTMFTMDIEQDVDCVSDAIKLQTAAGEYSQLLIDWCSAAGSMPVLCVPNCYWTVDDNGFSVASSEHGTPQFVTSWNGPNSN